MVDPVSMKTPKGGFRSDIQGLRGLAVLLVVLYHAGLSGLPGGYVGVDVFFVISGYLITGLLLREIEDTDKIDFARFYARRIRRLMPAAAVVLVATLGAGWVIYSPLELAQLTSSAFATAIYASNIWFAYLSTDYLASDAGANPLLHTWSLAVEEQFYLLWPLLLFFVARFGSVRTLRVRLVFSMGTLAVVSLAACILLSQYAQPWAFFGSPTRAWEFAAGGLIALWGTDRWLQNPNRVRLAGGAGLILILAAAGLYTDKTTFPGYAAIVPVLGTALVILAGRSMIHVGAGAWLSVTPLRFVGDISYSLYLWHWPVFVFLALEVGPLGATERIFGLAAAFLLAWLTYVLVENPVRFGRLVLQRSMASIALGVALTGLSACLSTVTRDMALSGTALKSQQPYMAARKDMPGIYASGCYAKFLSVDLSDCALGATTSSFTVVLFGDSHAAHWSPALTKLAKRENWRLIVMTKASCPSVAVSVYVPKLKRPYGECDTWRDRAMSRIRSLRPDTLILANASRHLLPFGDGGQLDFSDPRYLAKWSAAIRRTLRDLTDHSSAIVFLQDTPWTGFDVPTCLSRAAWRGVDPARDCVFDSHARPDGAVLRTEVDAVAGLDGVALIDMSDVICPLSPCVVQRDGFVLYRDSHHLTASFSEHIADPLHRRLMPAITWARVRKVTDSQR